MIETPTEGAPLAATPDRDRQQPVRGAHLVAGGLAGGAAVVFGGSGVYVVGSVLVPWRGVSFAGPSVIVGAMLFAMAASLARRARHWARNPLPVDDVPPLRPPSRERDTFSRPP